MLSFTLPSEHFGRKFDRGMILYEFDALREPERTRFPQIGAWLRAKGIEFNEVPTPQMLWRGALWPDLYIANQLEALCGDEYDFPSVNRTPPIYIKHKEDWDVDVSIDRNSRIHHGDKFHEAFIEPLCWKIAGRPSSEIAAKYHRSIWLPLYWPQTLRARASIRTPFYYPSAGYAGGVSERMDSHSLLASGTLPREVSDKQSLDATDLGIAFVVAAPRNQFSVCFVVDESPVYRVTDQDACAGLTPEFHRYVVEYRGECNVVQELERLGLTYHARHLAFDSVRLTLPTIANLRAGWKPRPTINDQLWSIINDA